MWFCTEGGLNRYDGYSLLTYSNDLHDSTSISDDFVVCMNEDATGKLWVGTKNGLNLLDPVTGKFKRIELDKITEPDILYNWVTAIIPCKAGGIWVASRSGLYRIISDSINISWVYEENSDKYIYRSNGIKMVHYTFSESDTNSLNDNGLYCLYEDKNGVLWIGSDNGGSPSGTLHKLLPDKNFNYPPRFKKYIYDDDNPNHTIGRYLMSIYEDRYGILWIGAWQDGLYRFNPITEKITRFIKIKNDPKSINSNNIFFMTEDSTGNLWIATYGGGLNKINADMVNSDKPEFIHYLDDTKNEDVLLYQDLRAVYLDNQNQLWIGSLGEGVYKTRLNVTYKVLKHEVSNPNSLSDNRIYYIYKDSKGNIWAISKNGILNKWERSTSTFKHYFIEKSNGEKIYNFPFITEYENKLLVAFEDKIYALNIKTGKVNNFLKEIHFPDSLIKKSSAYQTIYIDENNNLLISNSNFRVLARKKGVSYSFKILPLPDILNFIKDSKFNIWFSTRFEGLYSFDNSYNKILQISYKRAGYNSCYGFVETKDGYIWASTSRGLMQYNLQTKKIPVF